MSELLLIKLPLICDYVTIKLQIIYNYVAIKLQLTCNYVPIKLQLIQDRQYTSIIADELIPVAKIQTYDSLHYSTLQYTTITLQLNYYFMITTCSVFESMESAT